MARTAEAVFHCSCPPPEKTHLLWVQGQQQGDATRQKTPESIQGVLRSAGGVPNTPSLWAGWKSSTAVQSWLLSVECAFCTCPAWLSPAAPSTAAATTMIPPRAAPSPAQHPLPTLLSEPSLTICSTSAGVCLHRAGVTHSLSLLQGRIHMHKASPSIWDLFSQCLPQMLQPAQVQNEQRLKPPHPQSCQSLVSGMLGEKQPLGAILKCQCQYFLHVLATNILMNYMMAQNIFFCSRQANCVAPSCFCHD